MPQATRIQTGGGNVTYGTALTEMHHNFVDAGYGGSQSLDLDDGSAFYHIHSNFFMHSDGFKTDYGGHSSLFHDNLVVVRTYGATPSPTPILFQLPPTPPDPLIITPISSLFFFTTRWASLRKLW